MFKFNMHILFNKTRLQEQLLPDYTKIYGIVRMVIYALVQWKKSTSDIFLHSLERINCFLYYLLFILYMS